VNVGEDVLQRQPLCHFQVSDLSVSVGLHCLDGMNGSGSG
jgi:hypothetical protein